MAKMFYTSDEAAHKLGVSADGLKALVTENKLREFRDGARVMFKVDQVDKLSGGKPSADTIGLSDSGMALPTSGGSDVISLADSSTGTTNAKEDTVVTGQGVSVFDTGDVKPSDAAAQTQIQSAIDDQLSLEGVGSGSGLLDLTRESDDTSLGAELLDEIYPGGDGKGSDGGSGSGIFEKTGQSSETSGPSGLENLGNAPMASAPLGIAEVVEEADASSGAFGGLALAAVLIMGVTIILAAASLNNFMPSWVQPITADNTRIIIFGVVLLVLSALFAGVGFFVGKATSR